MTTATLPIGTKLTIDGKEYAIIPMETYRQTFDEHGSRVLSDEEMTDQDWGDVAELERRKASEEPIPYAEAKKLMGLE